MRYAHKEFPHAKAFADALANDLAFRRRVLKQTKFAEFSDDARLLHREMLAIRTPGTEFWWNSHFNPTCQCFGCKGGKETDILAIFESATGGRFALHVEVKHSKDKFSDGQAAAYPVRARCWVAKTPGKVLPHAAATTALLFSDFKRQEYAPHLGGFETLITLEDIERNFPIASAKGAL